jgi:dTDP-4-dehydrorhamnose reductase
MRLLVLGATGMLGHVLCGVLADRGHEVAATWHSAPRPDDLPGQPALIGPLDMTAPDAVNRVLDEARPAALVNCAGVIKQRADQTDMAAMIALNALLPHRLAAACSTSGVRLIQISTDCVFSGQRGHYAETDPPDATDAYGLSKLLGEVAAPHLTLRTSLVGWQRGDAADSLLGWFWAQRGLQAKGYTRAYFSGLSTPALSRLLAEIIENHPQLSGLYHVAAERISKHDLLAGLNRRLGHPVTLLPDASLVIDRSLDGRRFRAETGLTAPPWDQMLDELQQERMCRDAD